MFRPPAAPLIAVDPYFSVWSCADWLYDDHTRHWTGAIHGMVGMVRIDGEVRRYMGRIDRESRSFFHKTEPEGLAQKSLQVAPLSTTYLFEGGGVELEIVFWTPLLLKKLDVCSRPVSYIDYRFRSVDGQGHRAELYLDVSSELCVDRPGPAVVGSRRTLSDGTTCLAMGTEEQPILGKDGDDLRIDWGYVNLVIPSGGPGEIRTVIAAPSARRGFLDGDPFPSADATEARGRESILVAAAAVEVEIPSNDEVHLFLAVAYDDIKCIDYFGKPLVAWWRRKGTTFDDMLERSVSEHDSLRRECSALDEELWLEAEACGGEEYARILSLAYRQAIAAHKIAADEDGALLFFSKECFSNGCLSTVDVSYPSAPLFLLYNPELVKGLLRPVFRFAASRKWPWEFAPHDVGRYPVADGQRYRMDREDPRREQMPLEECGNMIILTTLICLNEDSARFAEPFWPLLAQWTDYLVDNGVDPEHQLCTDDFAGHLARNANLAVKAIMGIAGFSLLCGLKGDEPDRLRYLQTAREMAEDWKDMARSGNHTVLAFGHPDSWSIKYNMVWERVFGLGLFGEEELEREAQWYLEVQEPYGTPLDSRHHYTKADWLVWGASLAGSPKIFRHLIRPLYRFLDETPCRTPLSDWYGTSDRLERGMHHRPVVGGLFIRLLLEKMG